MQSRIVINLKKNDIVRSMKDLSTGEEFMRTSTLIPNAISNPINCPPNFMEVQYYVENDCSICLDAVRTIKDNDNNPYAPFLIEKRTFSIQGEF